jgi:dephospho-CoA kinase
VGLTGGIGSGKSTALGVFASLGAVTVSADALAHEAYGRPEVRRAVAERFGSDVLAEDGSLDRRALAARVFAQRADRESLERLLHPLVGEGLEALVAGVPEGSVVVAEVPLLFEVGWQDFFDLTVALGAHRSLRRRRTAARFGDRDFAQREAAQVSDDRRRELADYFYENNGSKADLVDWITHLYQEFQNRLD